MKYDDNFERDDFDPSRTDSQALDDRDEMEGPDLMDRAAWNDHNDAVAHL